MHWVAVSLDRMPIFPDACVACGRQAPEDLIRIKCAYTRNQFGMFNVLAGERAADVPACRPCAQAIRSQHRRRFLFALLCASLGTVAAVLVVPEAAGWSRVSAMTAIILICSVPYFLYERLAARAVDLDITDTHAVFSFDDAGYAAEFERLNERAAEPSDSIAP